MITTIQLSHLSSSQSPMWYYVVVCVQYMQIPTRPNPTVLLSTLLPKFGNWMISASGTPDGEEFETSENLQRPNQHTVTTESLVYLYSFLFSKSYAPIDFYFFNPSIIIHNNLFLSLKERKQRISYTCSKFCCENSYFFYSFKQIYVTEVKFWCSLVNYIVWTFKIFFILSPCFNEPPCSFKVYQLQLVLFFFLPCHFLRNFRTVMYIIFDWFTPAYTNMVINY